MEDFLNRPKIVLPLFYSPPLTFYHPTHSVNLPSFSFSVFQFFPLLGQQFAFQPHAVNQLFLSLSHRPAQFPTPIGQLFLMHIRFLNQLFPLRTDWLPHLPILLRCSRSLHLHYSHLILSLSDSHYYHPRDTRSSVSKFLLPSMQPPRL